MAFIYEAWFVKLLLLLLTAACNGGDEEIISDDVLGLIAFKSALHDPSSYLSSWNEDDDSPCSWKFVECNSETKRVTRISLDGLNLSGKISRGLLKVENLKVLSLSNNKLSGSVSSQIALLSNLERINLKGNKFSSLIPPSLFRLRKLHVLDLSENGFSGSLPDDVFGKCRSLRVLSLGGNSLQGSFPTSITSCSYLNTLNVSNNRFSGDLNFFSLKRLRSLDISYNEFHGSIPNGISAVHFLKELKLQSNQVSGSIPEDVGLCPHLKEVDMSGNQIEGEIPNSLSKLNTSLIYLNLSKNKLKGNFPKWMNKFLNLQHLDLSDNLLTGSIQLAGMELSSTLKHLNLSWNKFGSFLPSELRYFKNLTVVDLRNNDLIGSIPADICESRKLIILQLDGNSLTGEIPNEIGNCSNLYLLSLSHNKLNGRIPDSISKMNWLAKLELEFNQLSGEVPMGMGLLKSLVSVNLSYNKLTGRIPDEGIFPGLDHSALQGNLGICSPLLKSPCIMDAPKPLVINPFRYPNQKTGNGSDNHMFLSVSAILAISAAGLIVVAVVAVSFLNASVKKKVERVHSGNFAIEKFIAFDRELPSERGINPESFLNKATEIGRGPFGSVYKATLGEQGMVVAIKRLSLFIEALSPEDFDKKVRILSKAKHPNIISLKGYYWSSHCQLLVSDYASNGSVQDKLLQLSWEKRWKIIIGTAKGISYLHHFFTRPIIHYNLKPSNILLDMDYNPMVSDYGVAGLLTRPNKDSPRGMFNSVLGYTAPEVACQSLNITEKCDIYGFGIFMLEIVTGKRPVEYGNDNVMILKDYVRTLLNQGRGMECVDPMIGYCSEYEVVPLLKLAMVCTTHIPSCRPPMAEVVQILQVIQSSVSMRQEIA